MIDREFSKRQIERLSGLREFHRLEVPAIRELVDVVQSSDSEDAALRVIAEVLETAEYAPTVATLRRLVWQNRAERPKCSQCDGVGYTSDTKIMPDGREVALAKRCNCLPPAPIPAGESPKSNAEVVGRLMGGKL